SYSLLHAISVRTSEHLSLSRQCGFASPAQLLSFLAVNQTQIVTSITTSGHQATPILRRRLTRGLPECTGEIGLTRKPERGGIIGQGPIRIGEQFLGALQTPCADMRMRRLADGGLEGTREMELAQAGNRRQPRHRQIALQIGFDKVEHSRQSARLKPFPGGWGDDAGRRRISMVLDEP